MSTLSVAEAAARMKSSQKTIYRLIDACQLPAARIGKSYVILESDVTKYIEEQVFAQTEARQMVPTTKKKRVRRRANSCSA